MIQKSLHTHAQVYTTYVCYLVRVFVCVCVCVCVCARARRDFRITSNFLHLVFLQLHRNFQLSCAFIKLVTFKAVSFEGSVPVQFCSINFNRNIVL
jgi:hypothetical protein